MASLREIRARITSVQGTLKITSAMKMVASAKLHRIQADASALAEYGRRLSDIAEALCAPDMTAASPLLMPHDRLGLAVVVAFSSDNSLCGAFNSNAFKATASEVETLRSEGFEEVTVIPIGKKIAKAVAKAGYCTEERFHSLMARPDYEGTAALADWLMKEYTEQKIDRVVLVYNRFFSMGHQAPVQETLLPMTVAEEKTDTAHGYATEYICEPRAGTLIAELLPYTLRTQLHAVLLDSMTAEQAARTVAMQTATDNATDLLDGLSLTYNKRRQQAITDELAYITQTE